MRSLGTLPRYVNSQAYGLNDRGEVVGWTYSTNPVTGATVQNFRGFLVDRAGVMHDLGTLGGATAVRATSRTADASSAPPASPTAAAAPSSTTTAR